MKDLNMQQETIKILEEKTGNNLFDLGLSNLILDMFPTCQYYLAMKKNEILPFAIMWKEVEGIMLSEISQSEKGRYHMFSLYVEFEKLNRRP